MKHSIILILFASILLFPAQSFAQPGERGPRREMKPKEIAEMRTNMLESELSLTEKQRKKVYKLYLKEAKAMQSQSSSSTSRPMGPPPGGGPGGMGHDGMMPPPSGGDFGDGPGMGRGMPGHGKPGGMPEESDEDIAKREAKMKKILSTEQYDQWIALEKKRRHKEFQDKLLRDAEKPL